MRFHSPGIFALSLVATSALAAAPPTPSELALPFVRDDYSRAVAEARARKVPLFVESWAPW